MIDPQPVVVLYKNRINPTNRYWKKYTQRDETQRESLRGKNAIVFTCLSENRLHSARPENALHLNSTLARMPFYDRAYPEKHWSVSPGIPVVLMKRSLSLIFVPLDEKSSEESTSLEDYLTINANKFLRKVRSKYQLEKKPINIHCAWNFPQLNWHASLWGKLNVLNFWYCRKILENYFFQKIFDQKLVENFLATYRMQPTFHILSPNQNCDTIHGIFGQRSASKQHLPSEKTWVSIYFHPKGPRKNFQFPSITTLPMELTNTPTSPTYALVGKERQS